MKKILFVKLSSLGDILHATPALRELKNRHQKDDIYFLINKSCRIMIDKNPNVKEIIEAEDIGGTENKIKEGLKLLRLYQKLYKYHFDKIYIFHRNKILLDFMKMLKNKKITIFAEKSYTKGKIKFVKFDLMENSIYRNLRLIDENKYKKMSSKMEYYLDKSSTEILKKNNLKEKSYVVIAPGGGKNKWAEMKSKRWSPANYSSLINKLKHKSVLIGDEFDNIICRKIKNNKIVNLCGKLTIDETARVIKESELFIGNDSMTLHLAGALEVPLVGIFGPTDGKIFNPLGKNAKFYQSTSECSPCYNPFEGTKGVAYHCNHARCMNNPKDVEKLYNIVSKVLNVQKF